MNLTRFVTDKSKFSIPQQTIKFGGFMPGWDSSLNGYALSTYRIDGLDEGGVWALRDNIPSDQWGRKPRARGDMPVTVYENLRLKADRDDEPPRHVNIVGWSDEKSQQKSKAQELAASFFEVGRFALAPDYQP